MVTHRPLEPRFEVQILAGQPDQIDVFNLAKKTNRKCEGGYEKKTGGFNTRSRQR